MSRKSVQRFCDNDMRKNKALKREGSARSRRALSIGRRAQPSGHRLCTSKPSPVKSRMVS
ncbi:hypothetical protein GFL80_10410 [Rhizobium leguminosarum bv. viciae]|nr:hypothetical protein [Rhizobium leguminosarum bv. viciae]